MNTSGILEQNSNPTVMFQFMAETSAFIAKSCGYNVSNFAFFCGNSVKHANTSRCRIASNLMANNKGKGMA